MWKILVGFIIFAAAALFLIFKAGDKVDMQGEAAGHNPTEVHSASASAEATTPTPVAAPAPASDATASSK
ncbi:hypothetical protein Undi14_13120 [Undibacterium sp. 14-3-2]|jgi:hypothetical protein|uniref:hypothetical protein n=1 Tax=Undibacterium sp. 14-3-2 TaxID=2800129 RepID=UPI001904AE10|nr:hypothetical protein [Undibacterium sp. 14-3-2]MBK1890976.1 hypothetical protein [Undibacterium sp. 14-3-2]